jgi:hypothetical protein
MAKNPVKMTLANLKAELAEVARLGQVFIDGDLCRKVYEPHAETFMTGDDMDFNPKAFVPLKQTLLRLERTAPMPCAAALWRRRPDFPQAGEALIFGSSASPMGGGKPGNRGYQPPRMTMPLATAFLKGRPAWKVSPSRSGAGMVDRGAAVPVRGVKGCVVVQHFVPIADSLGETAAVLEVFAAAVGAKQVAAKR